MTTLPLFEREKPTMSEMKLSDLKQDRNNANKGSARGQTAIETSLQKYGAGRSIVLDKDNNILCGNHTAEAASTVGLDENVIVVETSGDQVVAVKRTDLSIDDPRARELAYADNRSGELSLSWNQNQLKEDFESLDLRPFFTAEEVEELGGERDSDEWESDEVQPDLLGGNHLQIRVTCPTHEEKMELVGELEERGFRVQL